MKNIIFIFSALIGILFIDYVLIAIIGCTAYVAGATENFYCGPFCLIGITIISISIVFPLIWYAKKKLDNKNSVFVLP
jgi:hypothetical protein